MTPRGCSHWSEFRAAGISIWSYDSPIADLTRAQHPGPVQTVNDIHQPQDPLIPCDRHERGLPENHAGLDTLQRLGTVLGVPSNVDPWFDGSRLRNIGRDDFQSCIQAM